MNVSSLLSRLMTRPSFSPTAIGACVGLLTACTGGDVVQLPPAQDVERIWAVRFETRSVALAKNATHQLSAMAFNGRNEPMPDAPPIRFRSLNIEGVTVDSNGVITSRGTTSSAPVIAEVRVDGATYADTVSVYVTQTSYVPKSIVLRDWAMMPIQTKIDLGAWLSFNAQVLDSLDNVIPGVTPSVVSSNSMILSGGPSYVNGRDLGKAKLRLSISAYGRLLRDSLEMTVQIPGTASIFLSFPPTGTVFLATGGTATWTNYTGKQVNFTFDGNSSAIVGGNIPQLGLYASASRTFTAPGTYPYRDTINKTSGIVLVRNQPVY